MSSIKAKVKKILVDNGLDFKIEKHPLTGTNEKGDTLITPYFGLFNSSNGMCINTCKAGYGVSQNDEIVEAALLGIKPFGDTLSVSRAGSINEGRRVFIQLLIEGESKVGNDTVKRYVTMIDSNDGSTGLSVGIGDLTMSCHNQFFRFYKAGNAKFRHTTNITEKIKTIPFLIEKALSVSLKQIEVYNKFLSTPLTKNLAHEMVKAVLGYDRVITSKAEREKLGKRSVNIMDSLYNRIDEEMNGYEGYEGKGKNLWGLHSGVTSWTTKDKKGPKRNNGHDESLLVGTGYKKNDISFNFALNKAGLLIQKDGLVTI